ncbi:MAG: sensor domain-containing diguanylate cyclase [Gammaproteobacteria bacterium]|nr:MAG: sensor domain-containing diguanylate cyclase [Gammaproteobacteria bacterium]
MTPFVKTLLSKKSLLGSYLLILLLTLIGIGLAVYTSAQNTIRIHKIVETNDYHIGLISRMHTAARERIITLHRMSLEEDPFLRDELFIVFNKKGTDYITTRTELLSASISDSLRTLIIAQDRITQPLGSLNKHIADLIMEDRIDEARDVLIKEAFPLQEQIFSFFKRMHETIEDIDQEAIVTANNYRIWSERVVWAMTALIIMLILQIAYRSIHREIVTENKLRLETRKSDVTLKSIPDGVILCDNDGLIIDMNPIAETMLRTDLQSRMHIKFTSLVAELTNKDEQEIESPIHGDIKKLNFVNGDGNSLDYEYTSNDIVLDNKPAGKIIVLRDVTEINNLTRMLSYQAGHDVLTGLHNRREFERLLDETLHISRRQSDVNNWLCYIDIDKFKEINDTYGHKAGDQVLISVSEYIRECVRTTDYIARIGGDEFTVILRHCDNEEAHRTTERILNKISSTQLTWEDKQIDISASIGLVEITNEDRDQDELTSKADHAMYQAKRLGRNRLHIHAA